MATILYARVSTADQTLEHQRTHAEQAGFRLDAVLKDDGVSGVSKALRERPEGRRLFDMLMCSPQTRVSPYHTVLGTAALCTTANLCARCR